MTRAKRLTHADYAGALRISTPVAAIPALQRGGGQVRGDHRLQYQLLLQIRGQPSAGPSWASSRERLHMVPHGVVALVTRCERAGLVTRAADQLDRRQVRVLLTPLGDQVVRRVAGRQS